MFPFGTHAKPVDANVVVVDVVRVSVVVVVKVIVDDVTEVVVSVVVVLVMVLEVKVVLVLVVDVTVEVVVLVVLVCGTQPKTVPETYASNAALTVAAVNSQLARSCSCKRSLVKLQKMGSVLSVGNCSLQA